MARLSFIVAAAAAASDGAAAARAEADKHRRYPDDRMPFGRLVPLAARATDRCQAGNEPGTRTRQTGANPESNPEPGARKLKRFGQKKHAFS